MPGPWPDPAAGGGHRQQ
nr:hypothetical protein [Xanthomonas euvesicatoria]